MVVRVFKKGSRQEAALIQRKPCFFLLQEVRPGCRAETIVEPTPRRAEVKARTIMYRWWDRREEK